MPWAAWTLENNSCKSLLTPWSSGLPLLSSPAFMAESGAEWWLYVRTQLSFKPVPKFWHLQLWISSFTQSSLPISLEEYHPWQQASTQFCFPLEHSAHWHCILKPSDCRSPVGLRLLGLPLACPCEQQSTPWFLASLPTLAVCITMQTCAQGFSFPSLLLDHLVLPFTIH